jgi:hypothetical protein
MQTHYKLRESQSVKEYLASKFIIDHTGLSYTILIPIQDRRENKLPQQYVIGVFVKSYWVKIRYLVVCLKTWCEWFVTDVLCQNTSWGHRVSYIRILAGARYFHANGGVMMIMSMGWDYVSELRPLTGLLFIPQVIYEHGELRWNDIDRGDPDSSTRALWQSHQQSHLVASGGTGEENDKFGLGVDQITQFTFKPLKHEARLSNG